MTATLQEILLSTQNRDNVVADIQAFVDQEISSRSGVSAAGIKLAYKVVTAFAPGYYQSVIEAMLPDMATQLQPFWAEFETSGGSSFGDYLAKRSDEVSEALLAVTDKMAQDSDKGAIVKAYSTVRGGAAKQIAASLPNLGLLVQKYAGSSM